MCAITRLYIQQMDGSGLKHHKLCDVNTLWDYILLSDQPTICWLLIH